MLCGNENEVHFKFAIAWNSVRYRIQALVCGYTLCRCLALEFVRKTWEERMNWTGYQVIYWARGARPIF